MWRVLLGITIIYGIVCFIYNTGARRQERREWDIEKFQLQARYLVTLRAKEGWQRSSGVRPLMVVKSVGPWRPGGLDRQGIARPYFS